MYIRSRYSGDVEASRIAKIAGLGIAGFMVVAGVADRVNLNPLASQVAGFAGAFIGTLVAHRRGKRAASQPDSSSSQPPATEP
jgi:hypothetical protein